MSAVRYERQGVRLIGVTLASLVSLSARAFTVYDPAVHQSVLMQTGQEIAKFVQVINNQVNQIKTMTEELNTLKQYVDLFGNPGSVVPESSQPLAGDLNKKEVGQT